jgi:uncharacterized membrane protein YeiH
MSAALETMIAAVPVASAAASHVATAAAGAAASGTVTGTIEGLVETIVPSVVASILPTAVTTATPVTKELIHAPVQVELLATFVGALSGGLMAVQRKFDITGVIVLGLVAGLGGGIMRDVIIGSLGVVAFENAYLLITGTIAALVAFFFATLVRKGSPLFFFVDAVALGMFAAVGADRALVGRFSVVPAIVLGAITAAGGGVLRDMLVNEVPRILRPGTLYASAAALAAMLYVGAVTWLNVVKPVAFLAAVVLAVSLRVLSVRLGWNAPLPTDLSHRVPLLRRIIEGDRVDMGGAPLAGPAGATHAVANAADVKIADETAAPADFLDDLPGGQADGDGDDASSPADDGNRPGGRSAWPPHEE